MVIGEPTGDADEYKHAVGTTCREAEGTVTPEGRMTPSATVHRLVHCHESVRRADAVISRYKIRIG